MYNKVYLVYKEFDTETVLVSVCATSEIADIIKNRIEESYSTNIPEDVFCDVESEFYDLYPDAIKLDYDEMNKINPLYTAKEYQEADNYSEIPIDVYILEMDLIDSL